MKALLGHSATMEQGWGSVICEPHLRHFWFNASLQRPPIFVLFRAKLGGGMKLCHLEKLKSFTESDNQNKSPQHPYIPFKLDTWKLSTVLRTCSAISLNLFSKNNHFSVFASFPQFSSMFPATLKAYRTAKRRQLWVKNNNLNCCVNSLESGATRLGKWKR